VVESYQASVQRVRGRILEARSKDRQDFQRTHNVQTKKSPAAHRNTRSEGLDNDDHETIAKQ
jgi:hypothetical protein